MNLNTRRDLATLLVASAVIGSLVLLGGWRG